MAAKAHSTSVSARPEDSHRSGNPISIEIKLAIIKVFAGRTRELVMAKGQMKSNKEKKKPKAEWNKKKKGGSAPSSSPVGQLQSAPGQNPFAKKM
jgi:hypothetical protein